MILNIIVISILKLGQRPGYLLGSCQYRNDTPRHDGKRFHQLHFQNNTRELYEHHIDHLIVRKNILNKRQSPYLQLPQ